MSEHITKITDANFEEEVLKSDTPVLVDYWAEWCGPCKAIAPVLEDVAPEFSGRVKIVKMNIDENPNTPPKFGISSHVISPLLRSALRAHKTKIPHLAHPDTLRIHLDSPQQLFAAALTRLATIAHPPHHVYEPDRPKKEEPH